MLNEISMRKKEEKNSCKRKVRSDHGYPVIGIPKSFLERIALKLGQEVRVKLERKGSNIFQWEIKLEPIGRDDQDGNTSNSNS